MKDCIFPKYYKNCCLEINAEKNTIYGSWNTEYNRFIRTSYTYTSFTSVTCLESVRCSKKSNIIKCTDIYKHLGRTLTSDILIFTQKSKTSIRKLHPISWNNNISKKIKNRTFGKFKVEQAWTEECNNGNAKNKHLIMDPSRMVPG